MWEEVQSGKRAGLICGGRQFGNWGVPFTCLNCRAEEGEFGDGWGILIFQEWRNSQMNDPENHGEVDFFAGN
jgi:hypothetical protein